MKMKILIALGALLRIILSPMFLVLRIYYWIWDYDWYELLFERNKEES